MVAKGLQLVVRRDRALIRSPAARRGVGLWFLKRRRGALRKDLNSRKDHNIALRPRTEPVTPQEILETLRR